MKKNPKVVAHRGYAARYPENTMLAFRSALQCGCRYLELDVQLAQDLTPVIIHDMDLIRTGNKDLIVFDHDWSTLSQSCVGEPERFGNQFVSEPLPSLQQFTALLKQYPDAHAFVEIKEESINLFGADTVAKVLLDVLQPVRSQCSIISFDHVVLHEIRRLDVYPVGFILHRYDETHYELADALQPDLLICNYRKIPDQDDGLWSGNWAWFLYEFEDIEIAKKWLARGVYFLESMDCERLLLGLRS